MPTTKPRFKKGDRAQLTFEGRTVTCEIVSASADQRSIAVQYAPTVGGQVRRMALFKDTDDDKEPYRSLLEGQVAQLEPLG